MKPILGLITALLLLCGQAAEAAMIFTGDRIDGVPVIERLDVADAPIGQVSRYWFRVSDQSIGQGWYVPVLVARGSKPGKRLLLTAGVHGDELNGIAVIHQLFASLDPKSLSGTVLAVPGLNTPGLLNTTRSYSGSALASQTNLNRLMPGNLASDEVGSVYAARLWNQVFTGNADQAIDLHAQSLGTAYPVYVFAQTTQARRIADMIAPDMIKMDAGAKGSIENTLDDYGIPAVTLELGRPDQFDSQMIARGLRGVRNVMIDMGIASGVPDLSGPTPFIGNRAVDVWAPRGGYATLAVRLGDPVTKGQVVATLADPFGRVTATVTAPTAGRVLSVSTSPTREIGALLVRILSWSDDEPCKQIGCP